MKPETIEFSASGQIPLTLTVDRIFDAGEPTRSADIHAYESAVLDQSISSVGWSNISGLIEPFQCTQGNFREEMTCTQGSSSRQRQLVATLSYHLTGSWFSSIPEITSVLLGESKNLYLTEANGPLFNHFIKYFGRPENMIFTEYFGEIDEVGEIVNGVRNEDLQSLRFEENSFDVILTGDVMEHVPDAVAAEEEIVRVLKPGGIYCFTLPFDVEAAEDDVRAVLDENGEPKFLDDPIYHEDPLRPEGILVFRIFSLPGMAKRFSALGCNFYAYRLWSKQMGFLGNNGYVFVAQKHHA